MPPAPSALISQLARARLDGDRHRKRPPSRRADWSAQLAAVNPLQYLPPRSADVELSLHQLAVMLRGGLTLLTAHAHGGRAGPPAGRCAKSGSRSPSASRAGPSLADAMAEHNCFSKLVVQLVRVGEQTGNLEQVVVRAADILEKRPQSGRQPADGHWPIRRLCC